MHAALVAAWTRRLLRAAACWPWLGGCAARPRRAAARGRIAVRRGVYMVPGEAGRRPTPENLGRIGNAGFIVGASGVIAIDTGTSHAPRRRPAGRDRRRSPTSRCGWRWSRTRGRSSCSAAPRSRHAASRCTCTSAAARLMAARCETCLKTLRADRSARRRCAARRCYKPDQAVRRDRTSWTPIGRPVRVLHLGHSSGPGRHRRARRGAAACCSPAACSTSSASPTSRTATCAGWHQRARRAARAARRRTVVPGHGPAERGATAAIAASNAICAQLEATRARAGRTRRSLIDVADAAELPDYERWDQYDIIHRRNASIVFLRFERELIFKPDARHDERRTAHRTACAAPWLCWPRPAAPLRRPRRRGRPAERRATTTPRPSGSGCARSSSRPPHRPRAGARAWCSSWCRCARPTAPRCRSRWSRSCRRRPELLRQADLAAGRQEPVAGRRGARPDAPRSARPTSRRGCASTSTATCAWSASCPTASCTWIRAT